MTCSSQLHKTPKSWVHSIRWLDRTGTWDNDFWAYNDLLDKATVPAPNRHINYRWDDERQEIVKLPDPPKRFDYDTLITIAPDAYHTLKDTIGVKILKLLQE